jgi:hypothetical protein
VSFSTPLQHPKHFLVDTVEGKEREGRAKRMQRKAFSPLMPSTPLSLDTLVFVVLETLEDKIPTRTQKFS